MRLWGFGLIGLLWQHAVLAQAPAGVHASYQTYAAGLEVADVDAGFNIGAQTYQLNLSYHTTGMVGFLFRGHQYTTVNGTWKGLQPVPIHFFGEGLWRGDPRITDITYSQGMPVVRRLEPPNEKEREPVPDSLQVDSMDTLTALVDLMHMVAATGRCELDVRTFDGRRLVDIQARTIGEEELTASSRSGFAGKALRCDFAGRLLAGFKFGDDPAREGRPLHGSAWLAPMAPGAPPLPVRMAFETRWFGDATMYLTAIAPGSDVRVAGTN